MARETTQRKRAACGSLRELLRDNNLEVPRFRGELSLRDFVAQTDRLRGCALSPNDVQKLQTALQGYNVETGQDPGCLGLCHVLGAAAQSLGRLL